MASDKKGKTKNIMYIVFLTMTLLIGLIAYFVIIPEIKNTFILKDELEEQRLTFESIKQDAAKASSYTDLLVNIKNNEQLLTNALIKKGQEVSFIEKIEKISKEVGNSISIEHIKSKEQKEKKKAPKIVEGGPEVLTGEATEEKNEVDPITLRVSVAGNYKQFLKFLYKLENMPYVFQIESIELGKSVSDVLSEELGDGMPLDYTQANISITFIPVNSNEDRN